MEKILIALTIALVFTILVGLVYFVVDGIVFDRKINKAIDKLLEEPREYSQELEGKHER